MIVVTTKVYCKNKNLPTKPTNYLWSNIVVFDEFDVKCPVIEGKSFLLEVLFFFGFWFFNYEADGNSN